MKKRLLLLMVFVLMLFSVHALAAQAPVITADGDLIDWAGIYSLCPGEDKIGILYAFTTDTDLCIAFQAPDNTNISVYDVLLDIDGDPSTGYQGDGRHPRAGADFLIETWSCAVYGGDGSSWEWNTDTYPALKGISKDNTTAEVTIPLKSLGSPKTIRMAVWAMNSDWQPIGFAPAIGEDFMEVPYYEKVIGAPITEPLRDMGITLNAPLRALSQNALPQGLVGTLTAAGGDGTTYDFSFQADVNKGRDNGLFMLEGDQLKVGAAPLAPGSYKVCLKVASQIRKAELPLVIEVEAQDPNTPITPELFDGALGQWYTVPHSILTPLPNLQVLKALTDGNKVFFYAAAQHLSDDFEIYIENEIEKGPELTDLFPGAKPLNKIDSKGVLYKWDGQQYADTGRKVKLRKTDKGVEGFVLGALLHPSAKQFSIGILDGSSSLPDSGAGLLTVTSPERLFAPVIKADGSRDDWGEITPLSGGDGVVGDVYAAQTADALYVLTYVSGTTDPNSDTAYSLNLLIDADRNKENGFNHPGYPAHSGIDVLVQDWHSMNLELFIFEQPSSEWFSCKYRAPEGIKKIVKDQGDGVYLIEYMIPMALLRANLPEVSDDLYVAVDRITDMQEGTTKGSAPVAGNADSSLASVPKYRTTVDGLSLSDESFADWDGIANKLVPATEAANRNLYATRSEDTLYLMALGENLDGRNTVYLCADGQGFAYEGYEKTSHVVKDNLLYTVTASQTLSETGTPLNVTVYADHYQLQIALSDLGDPATLIASVSLKNGNLRLPKEGMMDIIESFAMTMPENAYFPKADYTLRDNPYLGWMAWASVDPNEKIVQPFSTVYMDVKWAEFEPQKGQYDFDALESTYHLSYWKSQGKRVILRFVMDDVVDNGGEHRMDIPQWLYDELLAENYKDKGAGTFYYEPEALGGGGFSPNYESPLLIGYHQKAIAALGGRFDDPSILAFVQVGSLGHWAEMHTWPEGTGEFPNPELVGVYMSAYTDAFHNVKLAARKPYPYAAQNNWGLYNDMFGDIGASDTFRDYFTDGCTDMPHATADEVAASKMSEFWKYGYSGGEFAEGNVRKWTGDDAIAATLRLIRQSHSSLIGPCAPTDVLESDEDAHDRDGNFDLMRSTMGYHLRVESITKVDSAKPGDTLALEMVINNRGVAPFYYAWPMELSLRDENGNTIYTQTAEADITTWLPGQTSFTENLTLPKDLKEGTHTLCVAIVDPSTGKPGIHLEMEGMMDDGWYSLYPIAVKP